MNTSRARVVSRAALGQISSALDHSSDWPNFLDEVDMILAQADSTLALPFDTSSADPLIPTQGGRMRDGAVEASNAVAVYEFLGPMRKAQAADPRLWTYLTFVTYRDYMAKRWDPESAQSWRNRVRDRWLITSSKRASLIRNGIARLWWVAQLTYDQDLIHPHSAETKDHHAYAEVAFAREDRLLQLFDREVAGIPGLVFHTLESIRITPGLSTQEAVRDLLIDLTRESGFREIAALPDAELAQLVKTFGTASAKTTSSGDDILATSAR